MQRKLRVRLMYKEPDRGADESTHKAKNKQKKTTQKTNNLLSLLLESSEWLALSFTCHRKKLGRFVCSFVCETVNNMCYL